MVLASVKFLSVSPELSMAVAALALNQQFLCFTTSKTRTLPWLPIRTYSTITHFKIQKNKSRLLFISCSSSSSTSQSPEAKTETAESCVNLGLQLFSKGRVFFKIFFQFLGSILVFCFVVLWFEIFCMSLLKSLRLCVSGTFWLLLRA